MMLLMMSPRREYSTTPFGQLCHRAPLRVMERLCIYRGREKEKFGRLLAYQRLQTWVHLPSSTTDVISYSLVEPGRLIYHLPRKLDPIVLRIRPNF